MKVLMVSKALVVGAYQRKLAELTRRGQGNLEVVAVVPPSWRDSSYEMSLERTTGEGYELIVSPLVFNGNYHTFFFPRLGKILDELRPDILHVDEEPYNLATFLAAASARRRGIPYLFFTWQNLTRRYPPPFGWMERYVYRTASWAIVGTESAAGVLRAKGYPGPQTVIPQVGVDPSIYEPATAAKPQDPGRPLEIGFAGRLVPEKGVNTLVEACARLRLDFRLTILGGGPAGEEIRATVGRLGLERRVSMPGPLASDNMPEWLRSMDVVVLPSEGRPGWVEQFGRILVEAMACGVPVVASTCGELPNVVGGAGLTFPEGDLSALVEALTRLGSDAAFRVELGRRGRKHVLERFTGDRIAADTVDVYRRILSRPDGAPAPTA